MQTNESGERPVTDVREPAPSPQREYARRINCAPAAERPESGSLRRWTTQRTRGNPAPDESR